MHTQASTAEANKVLAALRTHTGEKGASKAELAIATGVAGFRLKRALKLLAGSALVSATGQTASRRYAVTPIGRSIDLKPEGASPRGRTASARGEASRKTTSRGRDFRCGFWGDGRLLMEIPKVGQIELTPEWTAQVAELFKRGTEARAAATRKGERR